MIKSLIIFLSLLFLLSTQLYSDQEETYQEILSWLNTKSRAFNYDKIDEELLFIFNQAKEANLPLDILFNRLKEAASKKIKSNQIFSVLSVELKELFKIKQIILKHNPCLAPLDNDENLQGIPVSKIQRERITLVLYYIKSDIPAETIDSAMTTACEVQKSYQQVFHLFNVFITITALHNLNSIELTELCDAVLRSKLNSDSYPSIASFFLKGHSSHINYSVIRNVIIKVLNSGGNLINIENELFRRGSSR
ncbi:MAG: hypothetical protein JXR70_05825 [Spirochaetales bacterium]|nr:hypothetical protein [Spirochaetales bacterium]